MTQAQRIEQLEKKNEELLYFIKELKKEIEDLKSQPKQEIHHHHYGENNNGNGIQTWPNTLPNTFPNTFPDTNSPFIYGAGTTGEIDFNTDTLTNLSSNDIKLKIAG